MDDLRKEALSGSDVLIDNNEIMLIRCNTIESVKYFAPETIKRNLRHYDLDSIDFIVLIDKLETKENKPVSYVILIREKKGIEIIDNSGIKADLDDIIKWYPQVENVLFKDMKTQTFYSILYNIKKGEKYDLGYLKDFERLISNVRYNQSNPGKTIITVEFDGMDDFLKNFDLDENDIWFVSALLRSSSGYYGYDAEFYSYDFGNDDWFQGYIIRDFNQENINKVSEILKFVSPNTDFNSDEDYENAATILDKMFERYTEDIVSDYVQTRNECAEDTARISIDNDFKDIFMKYYIFEVERFYTYTTSVDLLLMLYKGQQDKTISLEKLFKEIGHSMSVGPFEEYKYDYGCDDLDLEGFNRQVSRTLDNILEKIEDSNEYPDLEETKKIFNTLQKYGYKLRKRYSPPKDKDVDFIILNVDPTDNKIVIHVSKKNHPSEKRRLTLDEFNTFLHNYELFETKFFLSKKKL